MNAAIFYHNEAYSINGSKLMGRNAAGESFIRGYLTYAPPSDSIWVRSLNHDDASEFSELVKKHGRTEEVIEVTQNNIGELRNAGTLFYPGPDLGFQSFQRRLNGDNLWSLCGILHTTASAGAMDSICALSTAPIYPWDGVICPSRAVKNNALEIMAIQEEELSSRLGASRFHRPQMPVIPLGVHASEFDFSTEEKQQAREKLNIPNESIVIIYLGRLSFHAKAHPIQMYEALKQASRVTGKNIVLVECGWFSNASIQDSFSEAWELLCPGLERIVLDGRKQENKFLALASGDIFCSLADNYQETFGIVPIEGMASGLPVIVSDWNGYRDTVRQAKDGFLIPTAAPGSGLFKDFAYRHAVGIDSYDRYCGYTSNFISVDLPILISSLTELIRDETLRERLGQEGKRRANQVFDWSAIIPRYLEFWRELKDIRDRSTDAIQGASFTISRTWPARMDPSHTFAGYPTININSNTRVRLLLSSSDEALSKIRLYKKLMMIKFADPILPRESDIIHLLNALTAEPKLAHDLLEHVTDLKKAEILRTIGWLAKLGIVSFS